jgi:RNA polymerase sigma factor (sigma-70 family)
MELLDVRPVNMRGERAGAVCTTASADAALGALAHAAARGDSRAWESLVERFTPALRAAARGFRLTPTELDDVVQDTWLAAFRHIGKLQKPESIGSWLLVTARRQALRSRQRTVREILTDEPIDAIAPGAAPEEIVIAAERRRAVHSAVRRLPLRQRLVVGALLSTPNDSYIHLSSQLAMPIGSIGPTRDRALTRLRRDPQLGHAVRETSIASAS